MDQCLPPGARCLENWLAKQKTTSHAHRPFRVLEYFHGTSHYGPFVADNYPGVIEVHCHQYTPPSRQCFDAQSPPTKAAVESPTKAISMSEQNYDVVVLTSAAYETIYVTQRPAVLKEVLRTLRPGGYMILEVSCIELEDRTQYKCNHSTGYQIRRLVELCGFSICLDDSTPRMDFCVLAQRPDVKIDPLDAHFSQSFYAHQHVSADEGVKGRATRAVSDIPAGSLLMVDAAHVQVPYQGKDIGEHLVCSNQACSLRMRRDTAEFHCRCDEDVVWCSRSCQELGASMHDLECSWLRLKTTKTLRRESREDFYLVWITIRLLIQASTMFTSKDKVDCGVFGGNSCTFDTVKGLSGNGSNYPPAKLLYWTQLAQLHIKDQVALAAAMSISELLQLICILDANVYLLSEGATGDSSLLEHYPEGPPYAMALYTRATLVNHSCRPNVMHRPDETGRMVWHALRDIAAGEELGIAYIDLLQRPTIRQRRELIKEYLFFDCQCDMCQEDSRA